MIITLPTGNRVVAGRAVRPGFLAEPPAVAKRTTETQFYMHYTGVSPEVAEAAPAGTIWVDVSSSPLAYHQSLVDIWGRGETFALLEHDIICRPDIIEAFETCPEPWCVFGYSDICHPGCMETWRNEIGCTRFRAELMAKVPDALEGTPMHNNGNPIAAGWDWHNLCDGLCNNLRAAGYTHHWHLPYAQHDHWA